MIKPIFTACLVIFGLSACQSNSHQAEEINLIGNWYVESALSISVINHSPAQITFAANGKLSGNNSCNQFFGEYEQQENQLTLSPAGTSMMACVDVLMKQEQRVMKAMPLVTNIKTSKSGKLQLKSDEGANLLVLSKKED
ncbi:META domain-containing protein [Shewanella olleyana]|uniref:META domain-containing protein n=1 Tax=Shewanella olleyana TaxID=135626 RepID=UPI0020103465|nr:META domain-containing protein [Shewanella olleyana]MCL1065945.1 META domain-containing protein [Shewanella olleyana]